MPTYRFFIKKDLTGTDSKDFCDMLLGWPIDIVTDHVEEGLPSPFSIITIYGDMDIEWAKSAVDRVLFGRQEELTTRIETLT